MQIKTKAFGEVEVADDRIIEFPGGIVGFPNLTKFTLLHDEEKGVATIHWLQSIDEPAFAMPVMDPLLVSPTYNPEVDDELLKPIGDLTAEDLLVLVTVSVPKDITQMTANLRGPVVINSATKKAVQIILEAEDYQVKFPIYEILKAGKEGD